MALITGGEVAVSPGSLTVTAPVPALTLLNPVTALQGAQNLSVAISGIASHFVQGTTSANFGAGITVSSLTITSPISATVVINVNPAATLGPRNVTLTTGTEVATFTNGFSVLPIAPAISLNVNEGQIFTAPTVVSGSVSNGNWTLAYALASGDGVGPNPTFVPFASGSLQVNNASLGTFDPTVLLNGNYILRLSATDQFAQITSVQVSVEVERNVKVGDFTLSFSDITLPAPGLPITVVRTYDSRDKLSHDFGVGWTLSLSNVRLQKNRALGANWQMTQTGTTIPTFCLAETKPHFVSVTFPDNKVYKFQVSTTPQCQQIAPIESASLSFVQLPGTTGTQGAKLEIVGDNTTLVNPPSAGLVDLADITTLLDANQTVFKLTTADGFAYVLDQTLGTTSITDPNNNQITINAGGVTSSNGQSLTFARDPQGRITSITDPAGNALTYDYNGGGDLSTFVDRGGNTTTFNYDTSHFLTNIVDPRGVQAVRSVYDASGRLTDTFDAANNHIHYDHQVSANTEVITDRLGHITSYEYDNDGNILHKIQIVGGVQLDSAYTYDADDNKLSELLPGHLAASNFSYDAADNMLTNTDPLGNKTTYTYNATRQVTTIADANVGAKQGLSSNVYDPQTTNLTSSTDAEGHVTAYTYFPNGQLKTVSVDGVRTGSYSYDAAGNLSQQVDGNGVAAAYTYDANNNRLSQKVTRTLPDGTLQDLVTSYVYDANNRLTNTIYPDQTSTQVKYNLIGKQSDTINQLGRTTHYDYDSQGRLVKTTYPDATFEVIGYDAEGRRTSFQDRALRLTTYEFDEIGRLRKTHYVDTSFTETVHDAASRVSDTLDALRNKTHYDYDDADRRRQVTDAAGNITQVAYDNVGNQTSMTDALQHTTAFVYDRLGRSTQTIFHDLSTQTEHYDSLGRMDAKTDQAGKLTQFAYDTVGRLTSVTQFLNGVPLITSYGYDEIGNRISQSDANSHVTHFVYDQVGRRASRTLPAGQSESYAYDAAGNLTSRKDFNGHTTIFSYDNLNQLKTKTADVFFSTGTCAPVAGVPACGATQVAYTYTATGRRLSMTDTSGVTNYAYDLRDRLQTKATPFGTLTYGYDFAGNALSLTSSNANGASMAYAYDPLNRLASVTDISGATTYGYDAVGNLAGYSYPNGVSTSYTYDPLNRLTNMQSNCGAAPACGAPGTTVASYGYTLGAAGNRLSVAELSGRSVAYGYDDLYRLTSENVSGDLGGRNGVVSYTFDSVGNRTQRNSTLPAVVATGLLNYDANDRTSTDPYDANGNLLQSGAGSNVYDFENHLIQAGGVKLVYDGDGNRVKETIAGTATSYLVADQNLTGYAQVIDELQGGAVSRTYSYGLSLIGERQTLAGASSTSFYGFDGHGSVRYLTTSTGAVTDTYDYDAFGNLISSAGATPNNYLFAGEQFDPALGIYYNRARYYDQRLGRFWTMDTWEGHQEDPASMHHYLYANAYPIRFSDSSGESITDYSPYGYAMEARIQPQYLIDYQ